MSRGPAFAYRYQTHRDPGPTFHPREARTPARPGCGCSYRDHDRHAGPRNNAPNPIFSDCSKAQLAGQNPPNYRPEYPNVFSARGREAFNAHRQDGRGSGLVQDVLCSPARTPAAESRRPGLCAAPANIKRSTFSRVIAPLRTASSREWLRRDLLSDPENRTFRENLSADGSEFLRPAVLACKTCTPCRGMAPCAKLGTVIRRSGATRRGREENHVSVRTLQGVDRTPE